MSYALSSRLKVTASASLAASLALAVSPVFGSQVAVSLFAFANWCLFMVVTYFAVFPLPRLGSFSVTEMARLKMWLLAFLAFTIAGWFALTEVAQ